MKHLAASTQSSRSSPWGDPVRLTRFLARLLRDPRVPRAAKLKAAGGVFYAWIDSDIIPDPIRFIPGIGYVDDVIVVVHGIKCLIAETEPSVAVELWPGDEASFVRTMKAVAWVDDQLYGRIRRGVRWVVDKAVGKDRASVVPAAISSQEEE